MSTPHGPPPGPPQGPPPGPPQGPPPGPPQGPPPGPPQRPPGGPTGQQGGGHRPGAPQGQRPGEQQRPKRAFSTGQVLGGILLVLVVIFIFENTADVEVRLIIPQYRMPVALPIIIAAVLGALIAWLLRYRRQRNHPGRRGRPGENRGTH